MARSRVSRQHGQWRLLRAQDRLLHSGSVFKAEDLDGFVAFIYPVLDGLQLRLCMPRGGPRRSGAQLL